MPTLALSRHVGEGIIVAHAGEVLRIEIAKVEGDKVRMAFHADRSFRIDREEVVRRRESEPGPEEAAELDELRRGKGSAF